MSWSAYTSIYIDAYTQEMLIRGAAITASHTRNDCIGTVPADPCTFILY